MTYTETDHSLTVGMRSKYTSVGLSSVGAASLQ